MPKLNTHTLVKVAILSALSVVLMMLEIPLPFAPAFYKLDFSEVPVLLGAFSLGPGAAVLIELLKNLLYLLLRKNPYEDKTGGSLRLPAWRPPPSKPSADVTLTGKEFPP